jgi:GAF domain-containing protein
MLFVHDKEKELMKSIVLTGFSDPLSLPVGRGILGRTFTESQVYNTADAFSDWRFDSTFDLETGYRTNSLVSVPLINNRKQTIGVAQFLNKKDGKPFSQTDVAHIQAIAVLCALLIENVRMLEISTKATTQFEKLQSSCNLVTASEQLKTVLTEVTDNARLAIGADRASLFILDDVLSVLSTYVSDEVSMPETIQLSHGIGAASVKKFKELFTGEVKHTLAESRQAAIMTVNDAYHDPSFNKMIDYHTKYRTRSVLAVPIVSAGGTLHGVLELVNKMDALGFAGDDGPVLLSFANLAGAALESQRMSDIIASGGAQLEVSKWVSELESESYEIPCRLQIPKGKRDEVYVREFNVLAWNGIGLFKVVFDIFRHFSLLQKFQVPNSLFFTFLYHLRERYEDNPYHNWLHAVDVLQFFAYIVQRCGFADKLSPLELYASFVAMLAHDVGHTGLDNRFLAKSGDPYGVLYKDIGGVNELKHCGILVEVVSHPRSNIFHGLDNNSSRTLWLYITKMILATDPAQHNKMVRSGNDLLDGGVINLTNPVHRLLALRLLAKVSNFGNSLRTFEMAQQWWGLLQEEQLKQMSLESDKGTENAGQVTERVFSLSSEAQVLFMENTCRPLLVLVARIFPEVDELIGVALENERMWRGGAT